jgi:hypothetical protein
MSKRAWMLACAVGALGFGVESARAATATATATADATAGAATVTEITVTAEKREENLEKVPVAVSAFTSRQRDVLGIETIQDITNFTPGFSYSSSLDRAFIRGVGRQTNNLSSQPGVATYNDGVYNSSVNAAAGDSLFIAQTEVLRGPQHQRRLPSSDRYVLRRGSHQHRQLRPQQLRGGGFRPVGWRGQDAPGGLRLQSEPGLLPERLWLGG